MRIALNASLLAGPRTGIGRYVAELARGLPRYGEVNAFLGLRWRPLTGAASCPRWNAEGEPSPVRTPAWRRILPDMPGARQLARGARQFAFSAGVRHWRAGVYHEPAYLAFAFDGPTVVTAHDASWVRHPETHPRARVRLLDRLLPKSLERADRVIVDSAFVAAEMRELFGVPERKLRVVHLGVDAAFHPMLPEETAAARAAHRLGHGAYILAVGTLEPRKNLATLLSAYESLPAGLRRRYPLVIAGLRGWGEGADARRIERLRRQDCLVLAGYVPEQLLPGLYAGAAVFAYPSLYEGFGLPPLEAMACGVPVIVSDRASLPEIVGAAGWQVPALDVAALAQALAALLDDPAGRGAQVLAGRERAARFTWDACMQRTVAVYRELAA